MRTSALKDKFRLLKTNTAKGNIRTIFLVEGEPQRQLTHYMGKLYDLPLPWTYYAVSFTNLQEHYKNHPRRNQMGKVNSISVVSVYCSPKKVRNEKTWLDYLPLSNTAPGSCCFYPVQTDLTEPLDVINRALDAFWGANGTYFLCAPTDLLTQISPKMKGKNGYNDWRYNTSYTDWEKLSVEDILKLDYGKSITMGNFLKMNPDHY